ncbi:hypothetical protein IV494_07415 [Kaistella sp. G5-32]|uniref:DUF5689 domain-containing protein n=1 Tax=Kaistella gelatinilytica TaxID=2787636 RepID=A0ABS0FBB1_9FLAO|nr:hypothetical protein [Kaistella gelatinilytica]MBF8457008.1 hypothetical protein [Kaistella gelatinilytica]
MKKAFLFLALASIALSSCRTDQPVVEPEVIIETQNSYDDQAALNFLQTHYLDIKGNIKNYVATDTINKKLADLIPAPVTLPSGVIYIKRQGAQPDPGKTIGATDIIRLMSVTNSYIAVNADGKSSFVSGYPLRNTVNGTGVPEVDPTYFHVKDETLANATTPEAKQRSYYEIEGFGEALQLFKSFDIPDETNYNLQGVIIVPSRAAFARDPYFSYSNISLRNRSFVFNFQVYKTTAR